MSTTSHPVHPQARLSGGCPPPAVQVAASQGPDGRGRIPPGAPPATAEHNSAHANLICVAGPRLAVSAEHGQLDGEGVEGFYYAGRRVISRCRLLIGGREPLPLLGRMTGARQARFTATVRTTVGTGPDPAILIDRLRSAEGTERITVRNTGGRPARLPLELRLGTDLAEIAAIAVGRSGEELPASVHGSGLSWSVANLRASISAEPQPDMSLARLGLLRWDWELAPGAERTVELRADLALTARPDKPSRAKKKRVSKGKTGSAADGTVSLYAQGSPSPPELWRGARANGDDHRIAALFRTALDDANALLMCDRTASSDLHLAAGAPWRCALAPAESLRAARMMLPLGTRLAAGTLRTLARGQSTGPGADSGRLPGPVRHAGPYAPPSCSGTAATLLFPAVLAEARLWGLHDCETEQLLPAAERCLTWMLTTAGGSVFVPDPPPDGPYRCEVQALAHRAAVLGAGLLDACGSERGAELRDWAEELRERFREEFWEDTGNGPAPVMARTRSGAAMRHLNSAAVELLDTGLAEGGRWAAGLLTEEQAGHLCALLQRPALDSGWGLRSLGEDDERYNPFGHRGGAVRVHESATAVAGMAALGHDHAAGSLLRQVLDAAGSFEFRLPEMYAAPQRSSGGLPLPHPAACRPAATSAAASVQLLATLAGVRPDVPAGSVTVRPLKTAPVGALQLSGLRVAGAPFSVRIGSDGEAEADGSASGLEVDVS